MSVKRRRRNKYSSSSSSDTSDESGDELKPIGAFMKDRHEMVENMFHAVPGQHLNKLLPDVLKVGLLVFI